MNWRRDGALSRATMVHGAAQPNDMWYDAENFLLDQVKEVLNKLTEGAIDDEIWGKIVIMERCRRVAKAYLRKTTVIVDGSEDEFDGKTLGFNHFDNPQRDEHTNEIRAKINDGVILKMDYQGNIKGMARGATPVICQGWRDTRNNCISDRLVRMQGRLNNPPGDEEKAYKMFDMRRFKHALEREMHEETPDTRSLLLRTCVRVALVKDGPDMVRTPCWFAVVNLVALDMLKEKIPTLRSLISRDPHLQNNNVSATETLNAQALTQIIAAAVSQVQKGSIQNLPVSPEQIAQLASTLTLTQQPKNEISTINKKDRIRKSYHCSTSSLDSSGEDSAVRSEDSGGGKGMRAKRWEPSVKSTTAIFENLENKRENEVKPAKITGASRPRLQDVLFTRSQSITSDYDSNREQFDSGSWSSTQSRYQGGRSTSSSVVSEPELAALNKDESKESSGGTATIWTGQHMNHPAATTTATIVAGRNELVLRTPSPASAAIYQTPHRGNPHHGSSSSNTACYSSFISSSNSNFDIKPKKIILEEGSNEEDDGDSDEPPSDAPPLPTSKAPSDEDFGESGELPPAPRRFIRGTARRWKCATVRGNILTINHHLLGNSGTERGRDRDESNSSNTAASLPPATTNTAATTDTTAASTASATKGTRNSPSHSSTNSAKCSINDKEPCDFRGTTHSQPADIPTPIMPNCSSSSLHSSFDTPKASAGSTQANCQPSSSSQFSICRNRDSQARQLPLPTAHLAATSSATATAIPSPASLTDRPTPIDSPHEISQLRTFTKWRNSNSNNRPNAVSKAAAPADFSRDNSQRHDSTHVPATWRRDRDKDQISVATAKAISTARIAPQVDAAAQPCPTITQPLHQPLQVLRASATASSKQAASTSAASRGQPMPFGLTSPEPSQCPGRETAAQISSVECFDGGEHEYEQQSQV